MNFKITDWTRGVHTYAYMLHLHQCTYFLPMLSANERVRRLLIKFNRHYWFIKSRLQLEYGAIVVCFYWDHMGSDACWRFLRPVQARPQKIGRRKILGPLDQGFRRVQICHLTLIPPAVITIMTNRTWLKPKDFSTDSLHRMEFSLFSFYVMGVQSLNFNLMTHVKMIDWWFVTDTYILLPP